MRANGGEGADEEEQGDNGSLHLVGSWVVLGPSNLEVINKGPPLPMDF